MQKWIFVVSYVLVCCLTCVVDADSPPAKTAPVEAKIDEKIYKLGPQDVFSIKVENYPNYSHEGVPVLPDGNINLPFYGQVKASGKTVLQLQKELRQILGRRFRSPELLTISIVSVRPAEPVKPLAVFLMGAIGKPGSIEIEKGDRVAKVIASAGGLTGRLDETQASLIRLGATPLSLDLASAIQQPTSEANITLQDGDTITLSTPEPGRVVVSGDVARPGVFEMHRTPRFGTELSLNPRLLDVLVAAGGVKGLVSASQDAQNGGGNPENPAKVTNPTALAEPAQFTGFLLRQGQKIPLQINEVLEAKDRNDPANAPILPEDFLTIEYVPLKPAPPPVMLTVFVEGSAARQPGAFTVPEGTQILEVIARAGGLAKPLSETTVNLRRAGNDKLLPIDLQQAFLHDNKATNPPLQNGDILMVREPDTIEVQVTGKFGKPSTLQLPIGSTLSEAIVAVGGLAISPNVTRLSVVRRRTDGNQSVVEIDPVALLEKHDFTQNTRLEAGDWINAAELPAVRKPSVLLSGEVNHRGPLEIIEGETLPELLARSGGVSSEALLSDVVVQRDGKVQSVDVYDAVILGTPLDFPLRDGDFVIVKKNTNRIMILESVAKPGPITMPEKRPMTLLDALNEAGGIQPTANRKGIVLLRRLPEGTPLQPGATRPEGVMENVQAFTISLDNTASAINTKLEAGDIIYVPAKSAKSKFSLGSVLSLTSLYRLFF